MYPDDHRYFILWSNDNPPQIIDMVGVQMMEGAEEAVNYFLNEGYTEVTAAEYDEALNGNNPPVDPQPQPPTIGEIAERVTALEVDSDITKRGLLEITMMSLEM